MSRQGQLQEWVNEVIRAGKADALRPCYSQVLESVSLTEAYWVLDETVRRSGQAIVGFKGALTQAAAQKSFEASEPACGVLLETMLQPQGVPVNRACFNRGAIETELGFIVAEPIQHRVDEFDVVDLLSQMVPMIELVDVGFAHQPMGLVDLVANNSAARLFLVGQGVPVNNPDDTRIDLFREGTLLHSARAGEVQEGQLQAAAWLVNHALSRGYSIEKGQVLMTGSAGKIQPLQSGHYEALYSGMQTVDFEIFDGVER